MVSIHDAILQAKEGKCLGDGGIAEIFVFNPFNEAEVKWVVKIGYDFEFQPDSDLHFHQFPDVLYSETSPIIYSTSPKLSSDSSEEKQLLYIMPFVEGKRLSAHITETDIKDLEKTITLGMLIDFFGTIKMVLSSNELYPDLHINNLLYDNKKLVPILHLIPVSVNF